MRDRATTLWAMADGRAVGLLGPVSVRAADGTETALRGHAAHLLTWLALGDRAWTVDGNKKEAPCSRVASTSAIPFR